MSTCQTCAHPETDHSTLAGCSATVGMASRDAWAFCDCLAYAPPALPVTPYDGGTSSGSSGTDTSAARAQREDADGTTKARHWSTLNLVGNKGTHGMTVKDLREATGWHHGQASGALSNLHHDGLLARLTETRDRCKVYVIPDRVADRDTEPHGVRTTKAKPGRVTRRQITLTVAEADALQRLSTLSAMTTAGKVDPDQPSLVRLRPGDIALVCRALTARDDQPARRPAGE